MGCLEDDVACCVYLVLEPLCVAAQQDECAASLPRGNSLYHGTYEGLPSQFAMGSSLMGTDCQRRVKKQYTRFRPVQEHA